MLSSSTEFYREGPLGLTIGFNADRGGWVLELASPPLWMFMADPTAPRPPLLFSQVVVPVAAYESGDIEAYLDALLAIHFERLGLLHTGWCLQHFPPVLQL
jgi:hypothetical protein